MSLRRGFGVGRSGEGDCTIGTCPAASQCRQSLRRLRGYSAGTFPARSRCREATSTRTSPRSLLPPGVAMREPVAGGTRSVPSPSSSSSAHWEGF